MPPVRVPVVHDAAVGGALDIARIGLEPMLTEPDPPRAKEHVAWPFGVLWHRHILPGGIFLEAPGVDAESGCLTPSGSPVDLT
ncbi:MAG: hypothetical protein NVS9B11_11830 [Candidatus Dormibacteraceae bacterium]